MNAALFYLLILIFTSDTFWQVLRLYDGGVKLLSGIKSLYVDSSACVRIKGGVKESGLGLIVGLGRVASCPLGFSMYIWMQ